MRPDPCFPRLTAANHRDTSPSTPNYNCVAWAAGDDQRWWQPGSFWPVEADPNACGVATLEQALLALGYERCDHERLESSFEKVALYGEGTFYTHAARQLANGAWTSKLGKNQDIEHDTPDVVAGGVYGEVVQILKRLHRDV